MISDYAHNNLVSTPNCGVVKVIGHKDDKIMVVKCERCEETFDRLKDEALMPHLCLEERARSHDHMHEFSTLYPNPLIRLECKVLDVNAMLPFRSRTTDAGYDVYSIDEYNIEPGKVANVRTGIALSCPPGYYYTIEGRSSMFVAGILPFRAIIDATYTGELMAALVNTTSEPYKVQKHDRVAQICLHKSYGIDFTEVKEFSTPYNKRGNNGFGSSGK